MHEITFEMLENEYWWGGVVHCGYQMPLSQASHCTLDMGGGEALDQASPLYLSSKGRLLWSKAAFVLHAQAGCIRCEGSEPICLEAGHGTLRGAYQAASASCLPFPCPLPDMRFFSRPQYNTWIELGTHQTTEAILRYARGILENGLPAGILMIDEGWQEEYGVFAFQKSKIPDPQALMDALHEMGFAVMLWVTPLVASAGPRFKELRNAGYLLRDRNGDIAIREWWNGHSAVLDLTNSEAVAWLNGQLGDLMAQYGVDGFKFDAGDPYFYRDDDQTHQPTTAREQGRLYNQLGEGYALNEFRVAWNYGGHSIVARLQDKRHDWGRDGLKSLIPHTILQGLLGYAFCCPDMVGGGDIGSFDAGQPMDEALFVRWAQANALMGMVQMSIAPWRVLNGEHAALVADALQLHAGFAERIGALARHAAQTGEPIVRAMAYVFPEEGFETVSDQFMLGDDLLVCPVLEKGITRREIRLPLGQWRSWRGEVLAGGQMVLCEVGMADVPYFVRA
jgi:alpha-glucosidase (family GH31 glycosyl hydrolase)